MIEMNKKDLVEIILKKVLEELDRAGDTEKKNNEKELPVVNFLGQDEILKDELEKKFKVIDNLDMKSSWKEVSKNQKEKRIIVSTLCIDGLISLSQGKRSFIVDCLLDGGEVCVVEEGIEYRRYSDPAELIKLYDSYLEKIKTFGIKIVSRSEAAENFEEKEEIYIDGVITESKLKKLGVRNRRLIIRNNRITLLALDYIKQNNIELKYD